jgi:hypothetical protein
VNNNSSLTLRHGDATAAVLGNYFETCGLRVGGADNLIANTYFTLNSNSVANRWPLVLMNGMDERPKEKGGTEE